MKLHIVPAQTGFTWVKLGVQAFRRQPLALAALFFPFVAMFCWPACLCWATSPRWCCCLRHAGDDGGHGESIQGHTPTPALLLITFRKGRQHLRHMLLLGALYAAGFLGIMAISALVDGGRFAQVYMDGTPGDGANGVRPQLPESHVDGHRVVAAAVAAVLACAGPGALARRAAGEGPVLQPDGLRAQRGACPVFCSAGWALGCWGGAGDQHRLAAAGLGGEGVGSLLMGAAMMMATMILSCAVFIFRDCFEPLRACCTVRTMRPHPPSCWAELKTSWLAPASQPAASRCRMGHCGGWVTAQAQSRSNIVELRGDVLRNGRALTANDTIATGDRIETGPGSTAVFAGPQRLHAAAEHTRFAGGEESTTVKVLRLLTGAVASVWARAQTGK